MEIWKNIREFEDLYQVSNLGRIRNCNTGTVKKPVKNKKGKMEINLWKGNKAYPKTIARVVYETFSGKELRKNWLIQYLDRNSENCSFSNLYIKAKLKKPKKTKYVRHMNSEIWKDISRI